MLAGLISTARCALQAAVEWTDLRERLEAKQTLVGGQADAVSKLGYLRLFLLLLLLRAYVYGSARAAACAMCVCSAWQESAGMCANRRRRDQVLSSTSSGRLHATGLHDAKLSKNRCGKLAIK